MAIRKEYHAHRFYASTLLVVLIVVVVALEWLLRTKILVLSIPMWLYFTHVVVAVLFLFTFILKWQTASSGRRMLHIKLSEYYWFFWSLSAGTAFLIGLWHFFTV